MTESKLDQPQKTIFWGRIYDMTNINLNLASVFETYIQCSLCMYLIYVTNKGIGLH